LLTRGVPMAFLASKEPLHGQYPGRWPDRSHRY
jgi:hypothetical protein